MTPEEVDQLASLCNEACQTETGKRLYAAIITDGLFEDIVRGHPDPGGLAEELGNDRIIEIARKELEEMSEDRREQLADDAADHLRKLVVAVSKGAFRAMKNGILDSDQLTPGFLINAAAVACVAQAEK
jgi:hypothetical protein